MGASSSSRSFCEKVLPDAGFWAAAAGTGLAPCCCAIASGSRTSAQAKAAMATPRRNVDVFLMGSPHHGLHREGAALPVHAVETLRKPLQLLHGRGHLDDGRR